MGMQEKLRPELKISSYTYDANSWFFAITLENGKTYKYRDIPEYVYDLFVETTCKEKFFREFIQAVGYREIKAD